MPPGQKKFVKYTFEEGNNKPRDQRRPSQSRQNFKQRDNNTQNRTRRHVSYTEKSSSKLNVLKDMINSFLPVKKPSAKLEQMMKTFPKFFNSTPKQPEPFAQDLLNGYLTIMGKRPAERQIRTFAPIDHESEEDPDWDSDSDLEGGIQSKKIDEQLIEKVKNKYDNVKQLRKDQLKRHEKQFLEDYYKQKHQEELEKQKDQQQKQAQTGSNPGSKQEIQGQSKSGKEMETGSQTPINDWTEYQEKQVNEFINMGFIEKISQDENDFEADDFSVQDQKSQSANSSGQSSDGDDDDIFGDEGPTTIIKKKEVSPESEGQQYTSQGTVVINSHVFSKIAEAVGIPPGACIWIIRNKNQRYKVSTQFMDEMYRLNNFCESLPYVSLNHSQFVHNSDVQKDKGLQIFKKFNARKHQNHHQGHQNNKPNRNFVNNKRKFQYKPNPNQPVQKPHLNKK